MKHFYLVILMVFISYTELAKAQVLFEGYSKITLGGDFIGFTIQRYEFDPAKKVFLSKGLTKYNELGGSVTESLVATANEALEPISYTYNLLSPQGAKTIEAKFEKGKLKIATIERGRTVKKERALPKGAFFSNFLAYVILKNPQGLKASTKYEYQAVAEEDGEIYKGTAVVHSQETYKGFQVYKIVNDFKDAQFISYSTDKGEMLATVAPQKALSLELVADPAQAVGGLSVSADNLKLIFGNIPEGKVNPLSTPTSTTSSATGTMGTTSVGAGSAPSPSSSTGVLVNKPSKIKKMELQSPPEPQNPGKQGARPGLRIQTKSK